MLKKIKMDNVSSLRFNRRVLIFTVFLFVFKVFFSFSLLLKCNYKRGFVFYCIGR